MIENEVVERINHSTYSGSLISSDGLLSDEISEPVQKALLASVNLLHLWLGREIRLPTKVGSVLHSISFRFTLLI